MSTLSLRAERTIPWQRPDRCPKGFETVSVHWGRGEDAGVGAIEVAECTWSGGVTPTRDSLKRLHALRLGSRGVALLVAASVPGGGVVLFGPNADQPPTDPMSIDRATRILQAVLDEPDALSARRRLDTLTAALDSTSIAGVNNVGLFASHELRVGVPQRADWDSACDTSTPWLAARGGALIEKLGFRTSRAGAHALVLSGGGPRPEAVAVLLQEDEAFDASSRRFTVSPVAYGLKMAEQQGVSWLLMVRKGSIRLYPARIDLGVGRKGLSETFLEMDLDSLDTDSAGYLSLLFSADALADGGTTYEILESSAQYAAALGDRLRDKVYEDVVPELSVAVAKQLEGLGHTMDAEGLDLAYQLTLRVFFRMLFQVYAEDRRLLPYRQNDQYTRNAIKTLAADLLDDADRDFDRESTALWDDLAQVWRVIDTGNKTWGVPAYNGGLFSSDPDLHPEGALIDRIRVADEVMGPVLRALLLDDTEDGEVGAIDFRSLSVREFGTIYEGLLESSLGLAEVDLTLDAKGTWLPAGDGDEVVAAAGEVYFHNTSGQRKGTGSYFTPSFMVEHLLKRALGPALDAHLARVAEMLANGDEAGAADAFFDFKVADLAMGSGHFLTAAIDHIEAGMAAFLAEDGHHVPGVAKELALLGASAKEALGGTAEEPDPSSLLRRQIARRCVYGLDINSIAVELARVSIWMHTFVRGLPMSSLDHNLVCGNSLTGIGSVEEALDVLVPGRSGRSTLFDAPITNALEVARTSLLDVAASPESNLIETRRASRAYQKAYEQAETAKLLFDAAVLIRIDRADLVTMHGQQADELGIETVSQLAAREEPQTALAPLMPAHMPVLFPEVFLRNNGGFDVLLGNPPWESPHIKVDRWWNSRFPGLIVLSDEEKEVRIADLREQWLELETEFVREREATDRFRSALILQRLPGLGSGHVDLYQAFAWRNWRLLRSGGRAGVVLPRGAHSGSALAQWRREVLSEGAFEDVCFIENTRRWAFDIEARYTIGLTVFAKEPSAVVRWSGPFASESDFRDGFSNLAEVGVNEFLSWTDTSSFFLIPDPTSVEVFRTMKRNPSFRDQDDSWAMRPTRGDLLKWAEIDRTGEVLLPIRQGRTFNIWEPDAGPARAHVNEKQFRGTYLDYLERASGNRRSAHYGRQFTDTDLPIDHARIAMRWISRATDSRTCIAALLPPCCATDDSASVMHLLRGTAKEEAYVLGVLASVPFDWQARLLTEMNFTFEVLNQLGFPRTDVSIGLGARVVEISGRLAAVDERYESWAKGVGVRVGSVTEQQKPGLLAELDALVAHLYSLSRDQVEHIFATFHRGWDYQPRLQAVLEHFDKIEVPK